MRRDRTRLERHLERTPLVRKGHRRLGMMREGGGEDDARVHLRTRHAEEIGNTSGLGLGHEARGIDRRANGEFFSLAGSVGQIRTLARVPGLQEVGTQHGFAIVETGR